MPKKSLLPSHFYSVLNSYYFNRKNVDYLNWKESKGMLSSEDSERLVGCTAKMAVLERELYEACCDAVE